MRWTQSVRAKAQSWKVRDERLDWPDSELTHIRLHRTIYYSFGRLDSKAKGRNIMMPSGRTRSQVAKGLIVIASVLLVGIVVLAAGHFSGNRIAFYAGVFVTLAGVLTGIQQVVAHNHPCKSGR
jgi:hypothetical protein